MVTMAQLTRLALFLLVFRHKRLVRFLQSAGHLPLQYSPASLFSSLSRTHLFRFYLSSPWNLHALYLSPAGTAAHNLCSFTPGTNYMQARFCIKTPSKTSCDATNHMRWIFVIKIFNTGRTRNTQGDASVNSTPRGAPKVSSKERIVCHSVVLCIIALSLPHRYPTVLPTHTTSLGAGIPSSAGRRCSRLFL